MVRRPSHPISKMSSGDSLREAGTGAHLGYVGHESSAAVAPYPGTQIAIEWVLLHTQYYGVPASQNIYDAQNMTMFSLRSGPTTPVSMKQ
jgi:hypothetical protein